MKNFFKLFNKRDLLVFGFLFIGLFIYSLIEIFSIGLIPLLVQIILDPLKISEIYYHPWLNEYLSNENKENLIFVFSIIIITIFIMKNLFLLLITWLNEMKLKNWITNLSHSFVKKSFNLSYENFIKSDHSKMTNIVVNEFDTIRFIIRTYFIIFKELLVLITLCITFLYLNPIFFLVVFSGISFVSIILFSYLKKGLKNNGAEQLQIKGQQIKVLDVVFRGIKYIKIFNKTKYFSNILFNLTQNRNKIGLIVQVINVLPKLLIEIFLLLFFLITCNLLFLTLGGNPDKFFITISLMAVIIVRLIPIYTNLNSSFIALKFSSPALKSVTSYLIENAVKQDEKFTNENIDLLSKFQKLDIKNLCYKFKTESSNSFLIKDINFEIHKGEKIGIIGKTGSGKTTLINCILGLLKPDTGDIIFNKNKSIFNNIIGWHNKISFVPQDIFLMDNNIYQNIALSHEINKLEKEKIDNILKSVNLTKFLNNYDLNLGDKASKISEGEKQRVGIARALFKESEFLILDETTSSLDVNTERDIMKSLKDQFFDMTIITIAHRLSTIVDCDKVILMDEGRQIKIGDPKSVIKYFTKQ